MGAQLTGERDRAGRAWTGAAWRRRGVITMSRFENMSDIDADRRVIIENLAVEFERRLFTVMHPEGSSPPNEGVPCAVPDGGDGEAGALTGGSLGGGAPPAGGRTEALISRGRPGSRRPRRRRLLAPWRLLAAGAVALLAGIVAALVATRGP